MTNPADGPSPPEFSDSDLQWYAALSGQAPPQGSPAAREGGALRAALELRRQEIEADPELAAATSDEAMQVQLQRLRERIAREGTFDRAPPAEPAAPASPPTAAKVIEFPWWRRRGALVAMAASVLVAVVLVQQITSQPDYPQPPVMMGADGLQQLRAAQPRQAAEQLAERLRQAGLRPGLYQRGPSYVVDVNLLAAELPAAQAAFAALGLKPAVGFNRVEIGPS